MMQLSVAALEPLENNPEYGYMYTVVPDSNWFVCAYFNKVAETWAILARYGAYQYEAGAQIHFAYDTLLYLGPMEAQCYVYHLIHKYTGAGAP